MTLLVALSFLLLMALGIPVAFAMGLSSLAYLVIQRESTIEIPMRMTGGIDSFTLLAIPFFILAGSLMNSGGITIRLVRFAMACVGQFRGGLGHVVVVTNMVMAGMSGSATADCAATGAILIPTMVRAGYSKSFSSAIVASASTIGPIIPPSIPFVIYGSVNDVSTAALFLGGVIPGTLMGIYLMITNYIVARRRGYAAAGTFTCGELVAATREAILPLGAPIILVGGILGGVFTPTEAAVVCTVYAFVLGVHYRELTPRVVERVLRETVIMNGIVLFIVAMAQVHGWILAVERVPNLLTAAFRQMTDNPAVVLLIINLLILVLGMFVSGIAINLIFLPILLGLAKQYGIDPVHFGVFAVLNLVLGAITPPVGMAMYIVCSIAKITIVEFTKEMWPFLIALLLVLAMTTYIPALSTFLPNLLLGH